MFSSLTEFTRRYAYHPHVSWWLYFYSVIESVFFPIPPDVLLIPLALIQPDKALRYALIAVIGSVTGGIAGYYIGYYAFEPVAVPVLNWVCQYITNACPTTFLPILEKLFAEHGMWVIAISAISPIIPYRFCILAAGLGQMPLIPFIIVSFFAHLLRYATISWVVARYGQKAIGWANKSLPTTFAVIGGILLVVFVWMNYF
jgi:membrane protein YqaA with SNARE-associated domain